MNGLELKVHFGSFQLPYPGYGKAGKPWAAVTFTMTGSMQRSNSLPPMSAATIQQTSRRTPQEVCCIVVYSA